MLAADHHRNAGGAQAGDHWQSLLPDIVGLGQHHPGRTALDQQVEIAFAQRVQMHQQTAAADLDKTIEGAHHHAFGPAGRALPMQHLAQHHDHDRAGEATGVDGAAFEVGREPIDSDHPVTAPGGAFDHALLFELTQGAEHGRMGDFEGASDFATGGQLGPDRDPALGDDPAQQVEGAVAGTGSGSGRGGQRRNVAGCHATKLAGNCGCGSHSPEFRSSWRIRRACALASGYPAWALRKRCGRRRCSLSIRASSYE